MITANTEFSLENIDYQYNSALGKGIEEALTKIRSNTVVPTQDILNSSGIDKAIKNATKMDIHISIEYGLNAYVIVPDINKNNPMIAQWRKKYFSNADAETLFKEKDIIDAGVDLRTGTVLGDFTKIKTTIVIGSDFLIKGSAFTVKMVTGIILHEIGHVLVYYIMLLRVTKTNYLLEEGTRLLLAAPNKEQRIKIFNSIEKSMHVNIEEKESTAEKPRNEALYRTIILSACEKPTSQQIELGNYSSRAFEQEADKFAARHGYAKDLALGLDVLLKATGDPAYLKPGVNLVLNLFAMACVIGLSVVNPAYGCLTVFWLILEGNPTDVLYDDPKRRVELLKQQINHSLKDSKLSPTQRSIFVNQHDEIQQVLNSLYTSVSVYGFLWSYILPKHRHNTSLVKINQQLETLFNNDLFAVSARLEGIKNIEKVAVACGLIIVNETVVMLYHNKSKKWSLPMGKLEDKELITNALKRELKEELDINVLEYSFLINGSFLVNGNKQVNYSVFIIEKFTGTIVNKEPEKHKSLIYLPLAETTNLSLDIYDQIVVEALKSYKVLKGHV